MENDLYYTVVVVLNLLIDSTGTNIRDDLNILTKISFLINSLG